MRRLLSSRLTFFYKFIFSTMWIGGFSLGTLLIWLRVLNVYGKPDPVIDEMKWPFLMMTIIGTIFVFWCCIRLKKVEVDEEGFYVSNYLKTITIPVHDLDDVSGSILLTPELVWLKLKRKTEFGHRIVFMSHYRMFSGFNRHPLVRQLKTLIQNEDQGSVLTLPVMLEEENDEHLRSRR